jgi:hypothetical protein
MMNHFVFFVVKKHSPHIFQSANAFGCNISLTKYIFLHFLSLFLCPYPFEYVGKPFIRLRGKRGLLWGKRKEIRQTIKYPTKALKEESG